MSYRVGMSGGIGSGKSTVAAMFQELGVTIVDSDAIAHRLTQAGGEAIPMIRKAFGDPFLNADGAMDRARMRGLVFSDPEARRKLEAILHPLILARMLEESEDPVDSPYVLMVVPLLFESPGFRKIVDRTLVVDCSEETQIARAMSRSALSREAVQAIMAQQMSRAERLRLADDIIQNAEGLEILRQRVRQMHQSYLDRSSG
jgi:dephospho-CoA kinase